MPRGNIKMLYYLCYGSPLLDRSLDRRVDSLRLEGQGRLDGWRMTLTAAGRPNLEKAEGAHVWGCFYLIEEGKLALLDKEEPGGVRHEGSAYFEGHQERCVYYTYPIKPAQPDKAYIESLRSVYLQASLPQGQIDQAFGLVAK